MKDQSLKELDAILRKHYKSKGHEEPYDHDVIEDEDDDDDSEEPKRRKDPSKKQDVDIIRMMLANKLKKLDGAVTTKKESKDY